MRRLARSIFEESVDSMLCFYDIRKVESSRRDKLAGALLDSHDQVINASDPDKAVEFETSLLEEKD